MTDQSTWPTHLRDDAPYQQCGRCGRRTVAPGEFWTECRMPQPDGYPCGGRFASPGVLLDIHIATVGAPIPADTTTPIDAGYQFVGKGTVHTADKEPQLPRLIRAMVSYEQEPQLRIRWNGSPAGWPQPTPGGLEPFLTIVGDGTFNGMPTRMIAYRIGIAEHRRSDSELTTTISLYPGPDGATICRWMWNPINHPGEQP